jgi:hypothetical protein
MHGVHIRLGIHGDGFDIELFAGADDADGDLTTVGDEDFAEHVRRKKGVWRGLTVVMGDLLM